MFISSDKAMHLIDIDTTVLPTSNTNFKQNRNFIENGMESSMTLDGTRNMFLYDCTDDDDNNILTKDIQIVYDTKCCFLIDKTLSVSDYRNRVLLDNENEIQDDLLI